MLRNTIHGPIGFNENSELVLCDVTHPGMEPPDFESDAEREGGRKAALHLLEIIGWKGTAVKVAALRFAFGLESRSLDKVAQQLEVTRQAISHQRTAYCSAFGLPAGRTKRQREERAEITAKTWRRRKSGRRKKLGPNGANHGVVEDGGEKI